jgi:HlyD family secretion protein
MKSIHLIIIAILLAGCTAKDTSIAWGNFEAEETVISARTTGNITQLLVQEGDSIAAGALIAVIDTTDLALNRIEVQGNIQLLELKQRAAEEKYQLSQIERSNLQTEVQRFSNLLSQNAATQKQVDDLNATLRVKDKSFLLNKTEIQMAGSELAIARNKLASINTNIARCYIKAPFAGTVLSTYIQQDEFTSMGKPIVKLADMEKLLAVFYVSGPQLSELKLGQEIKVRIDTPSGLKNYPATISKISSKAEFTPKVIQTRDERTKLVYQVEAICQNDGSLKQGMPLEIEL